MTSMENINSKPSMTDVNAAFDPELRQAQQEWDNYLAQRRAEQGYVDKNGQIRGVDGKFKSVESEKAHRDRLYDDSMHETSRKDMGLVTLAKAAREANLSGDRTTFSNIQDDIQDRLIESADKNGWTSEQTDKMLERLLAIMHDDEPGLSGGGNLENDSEVGQDSENEDLPVHGPHEVYGPHPGEVLDESDRVDPEQVSDTYDPNWTKLPRDRGFEGAYSDNVQSTPLETDTEPETETETEPEPARGRVQYWSGNAIYASDPNRIPYSPAASVEGAAVQAERSRRRGILGRRALKWALGGALAIGVIIGTGETIEDRDSDDAPTDRAIELEATPAATPDSDYFDLVEPVAAPEATEIVESLATPTSTPVAETTQVETTPATDDVEVVESVATPVGTPAVEASSPIESTEPESTDDLDLIEPQPPKIESDSTSAEVDDSAAIESVDSEVDAEVEADPVDIESNAGTTEALMVGVEVSPGDGVTQVLAKVLDEAGYPAASPEQLFELYEELVTDPDIGPDAIFEGITLEYNSEAGEYWIQGEGGVETHLTEEAAKWLQDNFAE